MLKKKLFSITLRGAICVVFASALLPVSAFGQRRWVVVRPHRSRIVVYNYQPRPYVVYQRRPYQTYRSYTYGYPQPYYGSQYYTYGSSQPYYADRYYSYRYSQPYFANRQTYAWANPPYSYDGYGYRYRHRDNRARVRIWLR